VVGVFDFGAEDGVPYMALELVDGKDLRTFLSEIPGGRLEPEAALLVASDVAMALAYAHAPDRNAHGIGLVHRDVTTSNILLGRTGEVKLADFGIAKALDGVDSKTSGEVRGKVQYMSPEQMRGEEVDGRADLFSLGVVLFELLTGVRPFDGAHDVETVTRVLADERRPIADLAPELSVEIIDVVDRLLKTEPSARFPDAEALIRALEVVGVNPKVRLKLAKEIERGVGGSATREHLLAPLATRADTSARSSPPPSPPNGATEASLRAADPSRAITREPATIAEAREGANENTRVERAPAVSAAATPPKPTARFGRLGSAILTIALAITGLGVGLYLGRAVEEAPPAPASMAHPEVAEELTRTKPQTAVAPAAEVPTMPAAAATVTTMESAVAPVEASGGPSEATVAAAPASTAVPPPAPADEAIQARPRELGRVRIAVVPWGKVWIDHRPAGRAPRTISVPPGEHVIQAGFERPMRTRHVRVRAGRTSRVEFMLE
jgi:hypothetical protein